MLPAVDAVSHGTMLPIVPNAGSLADWTVYVYAVPAAPV